MGANQILELAPVFIELNSRGMGTRLIIIYLLLYLRVVSVCAGPLWCHIVLLSMMSAEVLSSHWLEHMAPFRLGLLSLPVVYYFGYSFSCQLSWKKEQLVSDS